MIDAAAASRVLGLAAPAPRERPREHYCPITCGVMADPVVAMDGKTYEREAIARWFAGGKRTSPLTRATIPTTVIANDAVRSMIRDFTP